MHSMMVSKRYPRLLSLLVLAYIPLQRCCIKCCPNPTRMVNIYIYMIVV